MSKSELPSGNWKCSGKQCWIKSTYSHTHKHATMERKCSSQSSAAAKMDGFPQNWARGNRATAKNLPRLLPSLPRVLPSMPNGEAAPRRALTCHFRIGVCKQHLFLEVTFAISFSVLSFRRLKSTFLKKPSNPLWNSISPNITKY